MTTTTPERHKIPVVSVVGVIALVLTLILNSLVGGLLIWTRQSTGNYAACTGQWQQQFGEAYRARLESAKAVDTALDRVIMAVAAQDPEKFHAALDRYVRLRKEQERDRASNPLPPLPDVLCGDPKKEIGK